MENTKKNQYILVAIIAILLIFVIGFFVVSFIDTKKNPDNKQVLKIKQIYSSDYKLSLLDDNYFIGTLEDKKIAVIVDGLGQEVYKGNEEIKYDEVYKMKDGRYLIYSNVEDKLVTYIFDGKSLNKHYEINEVSYVKPIIYKGIKGQYIVGFYSVFENDLYLYNIDNSGIVVLKDTYLLADFSEDGVYYTYNDSYLVVENKDKLMGVIDFKGNIVIDYQYNNIINAYDDTFIVVNKKNKYGVIDKNNEVMLKFEYKVIENYENLYLVVNNSDKMALFDQDFNNLTEFKMNYDSLIKYELRNVANSLYLTRYNGNLMIVNNYLEDKNGTEYDKHDLYIISNGKINKTINQIGFYFDDLFYIYDKTYKVEVYNENFDLVTVIQLENVKKINNIRSINKNVIEINYIRDDEEITEYYDRNGMSVDNNFGDLLFINHEYLGYLNDGNNTTYKLTVYDYDMEMSYEIEGNTIIYANEYLIVDSAIYKIEKN